MKFKVGDRVAVYGAGWITRGEGGERKFCERVESPWKATATAIDRDVLIVHRDGDEPSTRLAVYPQQCRRLVRKGPPPIWLANAAIAQLERQGGSGQVFVYLREPKEPRVDTSIRFFKFVPRRKPLDGPDKTRELLRNAVKEHES